MVGKRPGNRVAFAFGLMLAACSSDDGKGAPATFDSGADAAMASSDGHYLCISSDILRSRVLA